MINLSESSFLVNLNLSILAAASVVSIVVRPSAALPVSPRSRSGYRQTAKPVIVLIILISAFHASINQPFSESCGFDGSKRIISKVFLVDVCSVSPFNHVSMACSRVFCGD